ncbi:hypothetical protein RvVAR0630_01300 [Agrobacterium vitis]|nr:hypothetical protein RvVAR0630_01300 [Agrobacterium vitis]
MPIAVTKPAALERVMDVWLTKRKLGPGLAAPINKAKAMANKGANIVMRHLHSERKLPRRAARMIR